MDMWTTLLFFAFFGLIYFSYSYGKKEGKNQERKLPIFLIGKYREKDEGKLKKDHDYLIQVWFSYPQYITVKVLNLERIFCAYNSIKEFLKDWEPIHHDIDKMQLYLGGEYEFDFPKDFDRRPEITNYDDTSYAYLKNLFELYLKTHKEEKENLRKAIQEIKTDPST